MPPFIFGYRQKRGQVFIHAEEALVVQAILTAPPRHRAQAAREMLALLGFSMTELTLKSRITEVLRLRAWYESGRAGKSHQPNPTLKLVSVTYA